MGLFDQALLSAKTSLTTAVTNKTGQALSYAVGAAQQKMSEAAGSMLGTMGGLGNFKKISANSSSFASFAQSMTEGAIARQDALINEMTGRDAQTAESSATATQIKQASGSQANSIAHKVSLKEIGTYGKVGSETSSTVAAIYFDVLPEIVEQHTVEYEALAPAQFPGAFQKFKGTSTTQWTVNVTFISRTSEEAMKNLNDLRKLRGWTKPFYGKRTGESYPKKLGAPPPVLLLSGLRDLIGPVPVVITSLNWNWPKDVDYIATTEVGEDGNFVPFPTVMQIPIQLVESYSIDQFNQFSLADYRAGFLSSAFNQGTFGSSEGE